MESESSGMKRASGVVGDGGSGQIERGGCGLCDSRQHMCGEGRGRHWFPPAHDGKGRIVNENRAEQGMIEHGMIAYPLTSL
jgi:hypothetical protein